MVKVFKVDGKTVRLLPMHPKLLTPVWKTNLRWLVYVSSIPAVTFKAVQR